MVKLLQSNFFFFLLSHQWRLQNSGEQYEISCAADILITSSSAPSSGTILLTKENLLL